MKDKGRIPLPFNCNDGASLTYVGSKVKACEK
jgi:hypothetical protein